MQKIYRPGVTI